MQVLESYLSLLATVAIAGGEPGMIASGVLGGISAGLKLLFPPRATDFGTELTKQLNALDKLLVEQMAEQSVRDDMAKFLGDVTTLLQVIKTSDHLFQRFAKDPDPDAFAASSDTQDLRDKVNAACEGLDQFRPTLNELPLSKHTTPDSKFLTLGLYATGAALHMQLELMRAMWQGTTSESPWAHNLVSCGK
ncbi:hypothetical protein VR44_40395, partial [Streptomyces katrae]